MYLAEFIFDCIFCFLDFLAAWKQKTGGISVNRRLVIRSASAYGQPHFTKIEDYHAAKII
jgi:hypothetical protein